ncbi:unnamed protein product [Rhodiola kirilowii]
MVKRKSRQLEAPSQSKRISSPGTTLNREDDWVIVKKQKVTILIPPLHPSEPICTSADPCVNNIEPVPVKTAKKLLQLPNATDELKHTAGGISGHISPHLQTNSQLRKEMPLKESDPRKGKQPSIQIQRIPHMRYKPLAVQDTQRPLRQPRRLLIGPTASMDGGVFLNQMMRASNLDNKIHRAGGLSNWLASLGLHKFVGLFNRRKVDKFQLVNLTMKKLKDMGATAVGPRRKLMHAIDCLCQPYCFELRHIADMQP